MRTPANGVYIYTSVLFFTVISTHHTRSHHYCLDSLGGRRTLGRYRCSSIRRRIETGDYTGTMRLKQRNIE
jgi:hypothetical protein